jgi:hypothetical protein
LPCIWLMGSCHSVQWISEVMHFCAGLPIILVGCKKDLRRDPNVIRDLKNTSQRPVSPEEVRVVLISFKYFLRLHYVHRVWQLPKRSVRSTTWNVPLNLAKVSARCSNTLPAQLSSPDRDAGEIRAVLSCKINRIRHSYIYFRHPLTFRNVEPFT